MGDVDRTSDRSDGKHSDEARYRVAEANVLRLLDTTTDAIAVHRHSEIIYVNPAALRLFGFEHASDIVGRSVFDFVPPRLRLLVAERVMAGRTQTAPLEELEERLLDSSGREIPVEVFAVPVVFEGELATIVHMRDIRARKALELRLSANDRLSSVGLVAAGVVHEINTPLTYARIALQQLEHRLAELPAGGDAEVREAIASLREGLGRAAAVARDVKTFASVGVDGGADVDVHRVIDSCITIVRADGRKRVRVTRRYGAGVPFVHGHETRIAQVILNLLVNAIEAACDARGDGAEVIVATETTPDGRVAVRLHDNGRGVPAAIADSIFDPFVTTKANGTGLGLAISRTLVEEEGGTLTLKSEPGGGATFSVVFSAASRERDTEVVDCPPVAHATGKRILIVDDEPVLARSLQRVLDAHATEVATSGREALERLRAGERFDVILCDLWMADIGGAELIERIRSEWPDVERRTIVMTGAIDAEATQFLATIPAHRKLEKPFEPRDLLASVDAVVAEGAASVGPG